MNLVTLSRLQRNPTIKSEIKEKGFEKSVPVGFLTYPVSQAADITAFNARYVPGGEDQEPIIEQTREIVRSFNEIYGNTLVEPKMIMSDKDVCKRLTGLDGQAKMGKSLGNALFLSDEPDVIKEKIMSMYTDPNHIKLSDPGEVKNNPVFIYLEAFCSDEDFARYLPEYKNLEELKEHYKRGGLGDVKIKLLLNNIIQDVLRPIRERRKHFAQNVDEIYDMLLEGSKKARKVASETLLRVRKAIGIEYFDDKELRASYYKKANKNNI